MLNALRLVEGFDVQLVQPSEPDCRLQRSRRGSRKAEGKGLLERDWQAHPSHRARAPFPQRAAEPFLA